MLQNLKVIFVVPIALLIFLCLIWTKSGYSSSLSSSTAAKANENDAIVNEMNAFKAVFVTVPSIEIGKKIAHGLVSNKLAACVNIIPQITSVYEWEGKINEDNELLLMIKTRAELFNDIEKFVRENHPYSVPEVIAVQIDQGSQPYLDWIQQGTQKKA